MSSPPERERRFRALYAELRPDLLRFVQRREGEAGVVEDVVAEAFLVIWRRLDDVPLEPDEARAWAHGIARNVLLNARRGSWRHHALGVRVAGDQARAHDGSHEDVDAVVHRVDLARAWARLTEAQQETLALVVLDGLDTAGAAGVLGVSAVAFRLRLSRARRALRLHLGHRLPAVGTLPGSMLWSTS